MSRFVSNKTRRIFLNGQDGKPTGEWVDMREKLSFEEVIGIEKMGVDGLEGGLNTLVKAIKAWNLKDEEGNDVAVSPETIKKLDMPTIFEILEQVKKYTKQEQDPKKGESAQPSLSAQ